MLCSHAETESTERQVTTASSFYSPNEILSPLWYRRAACTSDECLAYEALELELESRVVSHDNDPPAL